MLWRDDTHTYSGEKLAAEAFQTASKEKRAPNKLFCCFKKASQGLGVGVGIAVGLFLLKSFNGRGGSGNAERRIVAPLTM